MSSCSSRSISSSLTLRRFRAIVLVFAIAVTLDRLNKSPKLFVSQLLGCGQLFLRSGQLLMGRGDFLDFHLRCLLSRVQLFDLLVSSILRSREPCESCVE